MDTKLLEKIKSKIFLKTNKSPVILLFRLLFSILFVDTILILLFLLVNFIDIDHWNLFISSFSLEENIVFFALLFHIFFFFYLFLYWFFNFYTINSWKVTSEKGIFFKKKSIFIIKEINSLEIYQSFFWRLFNYGDIIIFYNEKEFKLKNVPNPKEFVDFIEILKIE